ncbi:MAG TPA: hypothetical protein VHS99_04765 [Chloroflexota bacterium]|jgi:hypothetical protein|nr:hypothetical protein [Chloroflexota bacterium]
MRQDSPARDFATPGESVEQVMFCGPDCVVPAADLRAAPSDFLRGPGGEIKWLRYGRGLYARQP